MEQQGKSLLWQILGHLYTAMLITQMWLQSRDAILINNIDYT